ncbi:hydrogenase [Candidatus Thorarchaeota archaeon]|nr:MAG: hydrogenase [Candidatus Thorarchaeota archaeon]
MLPGKVPPEILEKHVFTHLGKQHPDLILGPAMGQDASLIRIGDRITVAATDPITGSIEDIGWLAVHVNANDIATFGVRPSWFLCSIMLPEGTGVHDIEKIMKQIDEAAQGLGIGIAGGHTEITAGLDRPIIAGFMLGVTEEGQYVTSSGAQPGDSIIMTKSIAIEGTAILATEGYDVLSETLPPELLSQGKSLRANISVVEEGIAAFETGYITAMHDPTEGGLAGGLHELCDASSVGCEIEYNSIPIENSTKAICERLEINPLRLISSGCMLITCKQEHTSSVIEKIEEAGVGASVIGKIVTDRTRRVLIMDERTQEFDYPETDELWLGLKKISSS